MIVTANKVVTIHYTLRNDAGEVLDSSDGGDPLVYLHGAGNIVPGLESQLEGRGKGDALQATVAPQDAYGPKSPGGPKAIPKSAFSGMEVAAGMTFVVEDEDGDPMPLRVVEVRGDTVMVDMDHPLAGETLHFQVEIVDVREATAEELLHGHVHGEHDHHH
ncbi:MAG: peptidylprolyl isomerase [Nannocystaceae bacterium]